MITFVLGAIGFVHELVVAQAERPFLLAASLALMGLPFVLRGDQRLNGNGER